MLPYLFQHATLEALRWKRIWPVIACLLVLFALTKSGPATLDIKADAVGITMLDWFLYRLIALVAMVQALNIVTQEVNQRTIAYWTTRPIIRWQMILARYVVASVFVLILGILGVCCISAAAPATKVDWNHELLTLILGSFAYTGLFLFISLIANRAMLYCIVYSFGWEVTVPNLPGDLSRLSIYSYMQGIAQHKRIDLSNTDADRTLTNLAPSFSSTTSAVSLLILIVVTWGLAMYWYQTHEYIAKEDAE